MVSTFETSSLSRFVKLIDSLTMLGGGFVFSIIPFPESGYARYLHPGVCIYHPDLFFVRLYCFYKCGNRNSLCFLYFTFQKLLHFHSSYHKWQDVLL